MPIHSALALGVFAPEHVNVIIAAYDDAWQTLVAAHSYLASPGCSPRAREMLAERIVNEAMAGILDAEACIGLSRRADAAAVTADCHPAVEVHPRLVVP